MFAVVDIETTGGYAQNHGITEIAVIITDGNRIIDKFETLLNPGIPIPYFITSLTGIDDRMVQNAPRFEEVAGQLHELLHDRIFVAHNVNFDYSFIKKAFEKTGINFKAKKLCTVRYARKVVPGLHSYKLGALVKHFGLHNRAPHRAMGDTEVTADILNILLQKDTQNLVDKLIGASRLPPLLHTSDFEKLPPVPGVYYFRDKSVRILYIGKAKNLKNRVSAHFTGNKLQKVKQALYREIVSIDFFETGSELLAAIYEDHEIRTKWPVYNKAQKKSNFIYFIEPYTDLKGIPRLTIRKARTSSGHLGIYYSYLAARNDLINIVNEHGLNGRFCGIPFAGSEIPEDIHRRNLEQLIASGMQKKRTCLIRLPGRKPGESGFVLIENNLFGGFGFVSDDFLQNISNAQSVLINELKLYLTECSSSPVIMRYIERFTEQDVIYLQDSI